MCVMLKAGALKSRFGWYMIRIYMIVIFCNLSTSTLFPVPLIYVAAHHQMTAWHFNLNVGPWINLWNLTFRTLGDVVIEFMINEWVAIVFYRTSNEICNTMIGICIQWHFRKEKAYISMELQNYLTIKLFMKSSYIVSNLCHDRFINIMSTRSDVIELNQYLDII